VNLQMQCAQTFLHICLVAPQLDTEPSIFRFGDFIVAFALLTIVYTVADARYRFRLAIAPTTFHLFVETFFLICAIGIGTLLTDLWLRERWLVPLSWVAIAIWRASLATIFLGLAVTWIYYAFLWPPVYSRNNYRRYYRTLYTLVVRGLDEDLATLSVELSRSAKALIEYSREDDPRDQLPPAFLPLKRLRRNINIIFHLGHLLAMYLQPQLKTRTQFYTTRTRVFPRVLPGI
jgi:hypothetical protein